MLMTKMAPLTVALCVAVALQPMLAASVQKEDRVTKTSVGERGLLARRGDGDEDDDDLDRWRNAIEFIQRIIAERIQERKGQGRLPFMGVPRTGKRGLVARRSYGGFYEYEDDDDLDRWRIANHALLLIQRIMERIQERKGQGRLPFMGVPRTGRDFVTGGEQGERGGAAALDPITRQVTPERVCAEVLPNGPLHEGQLPFRLIQRQFQTVDENGNGALEKTEVKKFLEKLLVLISCMDRTV